MKIGMIGLGKMGGNMSARLIRDGHEVVAFDLNQEAVDQAAEKGAIPAEGMADIIDQLSPPRVVWLMVPAGAPTDDALEELESMLEEGDVVVDGGNSNYKETLARGDRIEQAGIQLVDVGVSGGIWGLENGYGMMVGGAQEAVDALAPIFESLAPAPDQGWAHVGPRGSGHFVKMVHNGIEYGMMQAYAEGFAIMQEKVEFDLDLHQIAEAWRFGTVIRSWLLDLTARALAQDVSLDSVASWVDDSGEGRWTVQEAVDLAVPAPVISQALFARFRSRREDNYADKLLAAMRNQFGGHAMKEGD
ncbi:MAG: phosphogluconate dehydrogenase (NAD(+)-dependent, decarboxylating) [Anaerolineales bacterium]